MSKRKIEALCEDDMVLKKSHHNESNISKKRTPYILQKNFKMRVGMVELLEEITEAIAAKSEQEAIEIALGALIACKGDENLKARYNKILEQDNRL